VPSHQGCPVRATLPTPLGVLGISMRLLGFLTQKARQHELVWVAEVEPAAGGIGGPSSRRASRFQLNEKEESRGENRAASKQHDHWVSPSGFASDVMREKKELLP
jgi:hypothetical protein